MRRPSKIPPFVLAFFMADFALAFAHLANIALATGSRIEWDARRERITNNKDANKLLQYSYRKPWKLG